MKTRIVALFATTLALAAAPAFAEWKVETQKSPLDGSIGVATWIEAKDSVPVASGKSVRPALTFQCLQRRFSVLFDAQTKFAPDSAGYRAVKLFLRLDDGPKFDKIMQQTSDGRSASTFESAFARQLVKAKTISIEWTPFDGQKTLSEFDTAGFEAVRGQLESACKVKLAE